jgi:SAM-dependent methyltransferase
VTAFGGYARYYDLLYRDKDYRGETEFVERVIRAHVPAPRRVLELGCGTGVHGILLAERGYDVVGLDISEEMLGVAARRVAGLPPRVAEHVRFLRGDVRDVRVEGRFDAVLALFHVLSYQLTNDDLRAVFAGVKACLAPEGVFIFDCWYGPAVLTDRPAVRVKRFADENTVVTRVAVPALHPNLNRVDVRYQLFVKDLHAQKVEEISETHRMRYLFHPELELLAEVAGLRIESCGAWMSDREPDCSTWYVYFVVRHRDWRNSA